MHGCRLPGWIILVCLFSGCEVGRTMFQMDSNSGQPFFGVDLLRARSAAAAKKPKPPGETALVTQVRNAPTSTASPPTILASTRLPEPSFLERLKLKRTPERIALALPEAEEETTSGPVEEFR